MKEKYNLIQVEINQKQQEVAELVNEAKKLEGEYRLLVELKEESEGKDDE